MHEPIRDHLEEYLDGRPAPPVEAHLDVCPKCRRAVLAMREQARIFRTLRAEEEMEPAAGFYARVIDRIEAQGKPSFWNLLFEPAFGRRLMYASLALVVLMATYLVSTEASQPPMASNTPETILVDERPVVGADQQRDRDVMLVTLTTFDE